MKEQLSVTTYPSCVMWSEQQLTRPTTSFSRGCKLWSKERRFYEDVRTSNMKQFRDRPYLALRVNVLLFFPTKLNPILCDLLHQILYWVRVLLSV